MSEQDKQILDRFAVILPQLSKREKEYLLGFGNGMAANDEHREREEAELQFSNN